MGALIAIGKVIAKLAKFANSDAGKKLIEDIKVHVPEIFNELKLLGAEAAEVVKEIEGKE